MATTSTERSKAFRERQAEQARQGTRYRAALLAVGALLENNDKPLAVKIRELVKEGLGGE